MDNFLLAYIAQRMKEMGICHYHFEPKRFAVGIQPVFERAYNEFYFLTGIPLVSGAQIISDTNIAIGSSSAADRGTGYSFHPVQEFSGLLEMRFSEATDANPFIYLEFIHVVPTCKVISLATRRCCDK